MPSSVRAAAPLGASHTNRRLPFIRPFYIRDTLLLGAQSICFHISTSEGGVGDGTRTYRVGEDGEDGGGGSRRQRRVRATEETHSRAANSTVNLIMWLSPLFVTLSSSSNQSNIWL